MIEKKDRGGVQSLGRGLVLLKILAFSANAKGLRFTELMEQTGLSKGTLHRLLSTLVAHGFVEQAAGGREYYLGMEFLALGAQAANRLDVQALIRPNLVRLARLTGDTILANVRSGLDAVCIDREEGSFPLQALTLNIGTRRPLGIGSGGLALLASLSDYDIKESIRKNLRRLQPYPSFTPERLYELVVETQKLGYAFNDGGILSSMCGIGMTVRIGSTSVAISISANRTRMLAQFDEKLAFLRAEIIEIENATRGPLPA